MNNTQLIKPTLLTLLLASLAACGGGSSDSNSGTTTATPQSFSVQLSGVTITRPSNDESVAVDSSAVASDALTYTP